MCIRDRAWLSDYIGDDWLLALGVVFVLVVVAMPRGVVGELIARSRRAPVANAISAAAPPRAGRAD